MTTTDLIAIIGNISQSLYPIQKLVTGFAYLLGILFIIKAITVLKQIGDKSAQSSSQEKMFTPMMYFLFGGVLLYLPTALQVVANTAFGVGNVLTYANYSSTNIYSAMGLLIRTAGLIWFVRGCVLIAHASEPGAQDGPKGFAFLVAGILAMNFDNTISMVNSIVETLVSWSISFKFL